MFTGKHLCWSLFLVKLYAFRPATLLKRALNTVVFRWMLGNMLKAAFYIEHLWWLHLNRLGFINFNQRWLNTKTVDQSMFFLKFLTFRFYQKSIIRTIENFYKNQSRNFPKNFRWWFIEILIETPTEMVHNLYRETTYIWEFCYLR